MRTIILTACKKLFLSDNEAMEPINIHISQHIEMKLDKLTDEKKDKHLAKVQKIANQIVNAREDDKKSVVVKTFGYKKKILKKILLDILPEVAFRVCTLVPGILRIVL